MTIPQSRMIALINAARDYQHAFQHLSQIIAEYHALAKSGQIDAAAALQEILFRAGPGLLHQPAKTTTAIQLEYEHFRANYKRNERTRIKAAIKREKQGIKPRRRSQEEIFITPTTSTSMTPPPMPQIPGGAPDIDLVHDPDDPENFMGPTPAAGAGARATASDDDPSPLPMTPEKAEFLRKVRAGLIGGPLIPRHQPLAEEED